MCESERVGGYASGTHTLLFTVRVWLARSQTNHVMCERSRHVNVNIICEKHCHSILFGKRANTFCGAYTQRLHRKLYLLFFALIREMYVELIEKEYVYFLEILPYLEKKGLMHLLYHCKPDGETVPVDLWQIFEEREMLAPVGLCQVEVL